MSIPCACVVFKNHFHSAVTHSSSEPQFPSETFTTVITVSCSLAVYECTVLYMYFGQLSRAIVSVQLVCYCCTCVGTCMNTNSHLDVVKANKLDPIPYAWG